MASNEPTSRRPLQVLQTPSHGTHDQLSSPFFRFPLEIREAVYLALCENAGFSQHIVFHDDADADPENNRGAHFCRWPCTAEYDVGGDQTMVLQQVAMYWELSPITYANTRFVFTDVMTYQRFMGVCEGEVEDEGEGESEEARQQKEPQIPQSPPAHFMQYAREVDLSISMEFSRQLPCAEEGISKHSPYNFHWLQLDKLASCRKVNVWVDFDRPNELVQHPPYITDLSGNFLQEIFKSFILPDRVHFTLSTPLSTFASPMWSCGVVDELSRPNVQVWKRENSMPPINQEDGIVCVFEHYAVNDHIFAQMEQDRRERLLRNRMRRLSTNCWTRVKGGLAGLKNWKK
ncbi:hypothetical protein GGR53DRAFT_527156 [Hypoxylon sp. FL1150]|nr:hypothetical protein GGR53DRAFT_527156 [Hypoxylon sp. FL1150]